MEAQDKTQEQTAEKRIKELTEENELLFDQLHVVQEELEKYYYKLKEYEQLNNISSNLQASESQPQDNAGRAMDVPQQLLDIAAENQQLRALVEQQKIALSVETQNSLPCRLGNILIQGVASPAALLSLPNTLRKIWKAERQTTPPAALGGKSFQKIIDAHTAGGFAAVEKLLDSIVMSSSMRANAYTALARHLRMMDAKATAEAARRAWEIDPQPYRLKWLAWRVHDAKDIITAETLLSMLPSDISMSDSEERQASQIHQESKEELYLQAKKSTTFFKKYIGQMQVTIEKFKKNSEDSAKQKNTANEQLKKQLVEYNNKINKLTEDINNTTKIADIHKKELELSLKKQNSLQQQLDLQKRESENFTIQTARMLKNIFTQFESDTAVLSQVMRVVMKT